MMTQPPDLLIKNHRKRNVSSLSRFIHVFWLVIIPLCIVQLYAGPIVIITGASQRTDSSKKVDVYYNLIHDKRVTVSVYASQDNGATWNLPITQISGDFGPGIDPGNGKHIIWDAMAEHPNIIYENVKLRVIADDGIIDIASGLIAHYPFDGNALDASGNDNHATPQNNYSYIDGAISLVGYGYCSSSGGHVLIPYIDLNQMASYTISIWVNEQSMTHSDGEMYIAFGDHSSGTIGIGHFDNELRFYYGNVSEYYGLSFITNYLNSWMLYTLVSHNGVMKAYVNGEFVGGMSNSVHVTHHTSAMGRHWWGNGANTSTRFTGQLNEVRIYNRALSDSEILSLFVGD